MKTKTVLFSLILTAVLVGASSCTHRTAAPALGQVAGPTATLTPAPTLTFTLQPTATVTPIPTLTETPTPTETSTLTETPNSSPTLELSPEQLAAKELYGSGFELKTEFQGIPVDLTVVTSNATLQQYKQTRGCFPNQEMKKYGASAEDRMAEMFFLGHYVGYLRYSGLTETNYTFTQYTADLKAGADRSYTIWGPRLDGSDGEFKVNPLSPVEYVTTNATVDPDGNGRGTALLSDNISRRGYQQLENGGLRIVQEFSGDADKDYFKFCSYSSGGLQSSLITLGVPLEFLQGHIPLVRTGEYPKTIARLDQIYIERSIYYDSGNTLGPWILVQ